MKSAMRATPVRSPCCGAPVVGMVDVTLHPRIMRLPNGRTRDGGIVDTTRDIRESVAKMAESDHREAYCWSCGEHVDVDA